jgi:hypothetical protein
MDLPFFGLDGLAVHHSDVDVRGEYDNATCALLNRQDAKIAKVRFFDSWRP